MQNAIRLPVAGWRAYAIIFSTGEPVRRQERRFLNAADLRDLLPTRPFSRVGNARSPSAAVAVAGAAIGDLA